MPGLGTRINPSTSLSAMGGHPVSSPTPAPATASSPAKEKDPPPVDTVDAFEPRQPRSRLSDVIMSDGVRRQVDLLLNRLRHHKTLYEDWGLATVDPRGRYAAANFHGPPGTGKTLLAEAVAAELGRRIIDVSYAEIESKFVGETGKNIRRAFRRAVEAEAVLFFDEADSILGKRMTSVTQAADHAVNVARAVMLKELDAFNGIVLFATNLARNFDGAFVRRILQHVEVPPPEEAGRLALWKKLVPPAVPGREALDWNQLASTTDGLCGGDLKNAVLLGLAGAVAREGEARRVTTNDLLEAAAWVTQAKHQIGAPPSNPLWKPEVGA